jgi:hypothetical protein
MTCSQPQFQHVYPQMNVSNSDKFGTSSARFFLPLGLPCLSGLDLYQSIASSARFFSPLRMPRFSDSDLQQSGEGRIPSKKAKNAFRKRRQFLLQQRHVMVRMYLHKRRRDGHQRKEKQVFHQRRRNVHQRRQKRR